MSVQALNRKEAIASGEDIAPVTREEYYLKGLVEGQGGGGIEGISVYRITFECTGGDGYTSSFTVDLLDADEHKIAVEKKEGYFKTDNIGILVDYGSASIMELLVIEGESITIYKDGVSDLPNMFTVSGNCEIVDLGDDVHGHYYVVKVYGDCAIATAGENN